MNDYVPFVWMIINRQSKPLIAAIAVIFGGSLFFLATATATIPITIYAQSEANQTSSNTTSQQGTAEGNITTFNPQSKLPTNVEGCNALAAVMEGKAVPDHDLCDVIVYRQAPPIVRSDGIVLNNFSGIGHYVEFVPALVNETGVFPASTLQGQQQQPQQSSEGNMTVMMPEFTNDNPAVAFGEFALLDEEVIPVREVMQRYNWTETALHHHMLDEFPKMLFLHWTVTGTPNELIEQAREIVEVGTSTYNQTTTSETGISTPSSAGP